MFSTGGSITHTGRLHRYARLVVLGDLSTTSGDSPGRSEPELEESGETTPSTGWTTCNGNSARS